MIEVPQGKERLLEGWNFIDLFAGVGGFRYALEAFGAECVFSSEWDKGCQKVYKQNHGEKPAGDITKVDEDDIPPHEIVCGGFPCQAFSISGKQRGFKDARGVLFYEIVRIAARHKPVLLLLENVKNLASHDEGRTLRTIVSELKGVGYEMFPKVLNSGDYGVPHSRERVFIVAIRQDVMAKIGLPYAFPAPSEKQVSLRDVLLPDASDYEVDISGLNTEIDPTPKRHANRPLRVGLVNLGRQGERIYHPAGHAITLSSGGGGVGAKTGLYLIDGKVRRLAPRECARLMGLPDSFKMHPAETQCYRQFGNGVVVDVIQHIVLSLPKELIEAGKRKVEERLALK